jgi:hypothetical protein
VRFITTGDKQYFCQANQQIRLWDCQQQKIIFSEELKTRTPVMSFNLISAAGGPYLTVAFQDKIDIY